eukprot:TRINITY_DN23135_c0_g1_i1.p1 TRINITY_DN23135_c0_g1~~TRINITY_DN23135_c0_g1_i1.p1  ORF type:complete len:460 (+),score=71.79 TRINITY_DN23135_c0_g1_i1:54-1433(+)
MDDVALTHGSCRHVSKEVVDLVESEDESSFATPIQRVNLKRKYNGVSECQARALPDDERCFSSGGDALDGQDASCTLVRKLLQEEEEYAVLSQRLQREDEEYARRLQQREEEEAVTLMGQNSPSAAVLSHDDAASLALARKLHEEEERLAVPRSDDSASLALARKLHEVEEEQNVRRQAGTRPDDAASLALARKLHEEEEQCAKRQAMLEEISLSQPDMIAAQICEAVRQLPGNAERPGGSCVNYDCARAFFVRHKAFLDASRDHQTPIQIVYHGTPENGDVFRSIMDGNLRVPKMQKEEVANRSAYGTGVYTTPEPEAAFIYSEGGPIFMCLALPGRIYFCNDSEQRRGQPKMEGFDSHASPCQQVLVMFESEQILPVFLIARTHQAKAHNEILQILGMIDKITGNEDSQVPYRQEEGDGITGESFLQKLHTSGLALRGKKHTGKRSQNDWGWRPTPR